MTNYIITPKNIPEHYFFNSGICVRKRSPSGIWQQYSPIFPEAKDGFALYCAKDGTAHIMYSDYSGNLVYAVSSGDERKKYTVSTLSGEISVSDMRLYRVRSRLNLLYSAIYKGENLLIHCILGDHAKPSSIDTIETPHFHIKGSRVYYTNARGILGFTNLADEKPLGFTPVFEDAHFGTVYDLYGKEQILFSRNSAVFLNGNELARDTHLEMPILVKAHGKVYIMWKNSSYIRYIVSTDGENFSGIRRFMNTGRAFEIFSVQKGDKFTDYYGYNAQNGPVLLGNPDIFEVYDNSKKPPKSELQRGTGIAEKGRQDMEGAKKELARLGKVIGSLSEKK